MGFQRKNIFLFIVTLFVFSCETTKLEVFSIAFDKQKIEVCDDNKSVDIETSLFFKLKNKETLILEIPKNILNNKITATPIELSIPNKAQLYYRLFKENIRKDYFCKELPAVEPALVKNIKASKGLLMIETEKLEDDTGKVSYKHTFTITNLLLSSKDGQEVYGDKLLYGTFITVPPPPKKDETK